MNERVQTYHSDKLGRVTIPDSEEEMTLSQLIYLVEIAFEQLKKRVIAIGASSGTEAVRIEETDFSLGMKFNLIRWFEPEDGWDAHYSEDCQYNLVQAQPNFFGFLSKESNCDEFPYDADPTDCEFSYFSIVGLSLLHDQKSINIPLPMNARAVAEQILGEHPAEEGRSI